MRTQSSLALQLNRSIADETDSVVVGTVSRPANVNLALPLTVTLSSSKVSEATVPATVTIPAGAVSTNFDVSLIDDARLDGLQTVSLQASATGFANDATTLLIRDQESLTLSLETTKSQRLGDKFLRLFPEAT